MWTSWIVFRYWETVKIKLCHLIWIQLPNKKNSWTGTEISLKIGRFLQRKFQYTVQILHAKIWRRRCGKAQHLVVQALLDWDHKERKSLGKGFRFNSVLRLCQSWYENMHLLCKNVSICLFSSSWLFPVSLPVSCKLNGTMNFNSTHKRSFFENAQPCLNYHTNFPGVLCLI